MTTSADSAAYEDVSYHLAHDHTQRHAVGDVEVNDKLRYRQSAWPISYVNGGYGLKDLAFPTQI